MSQSPLKVVFWSGCAGDTQRYRCDHPAEQLRRLGHQAQVYWQTDPAGLAAAREADLVVVQRPTMTHFWRALVAATAGRPLVYETDDLVFERALVDEMPIVRQNSGALRQRWHNYALGNARVLESCSAGLASTTPLVERLAAHNLSAALHRNVLSDELLALSDASHQTRRHPHTGSRPLTIGYFSGTFSHDQDLAFIAPALVRMLREHPSLRLLLGGQINLPPALQPYAGRVDRRPLVPWRDLPALMAEADVMLAPLDPTNIFTQCRSELKYLEAAAVGVPIVASPAPAFAEAISHGETGMLAESANQWVEALDYLIANKAARGAIGAAAYEHVRREYTFASAGLQLEGILHGLAAQAQAPRAVWRGIDLVPGAEQWASDLRLNGLAVYMLTGCEQGNAGTYRCRHRQQQLDLHDIASVVVSQPDEGFEIRAAANYDLAIIHRAVGDEPLLGYIGRMQALGRPVLFDTDDLVFRPELIDRVDAIKDWSAADKALYRNGVEGYRRALLACDAAIVSTEPLAALVRELGQRAFVVRNALSWEQIERAAPLAEARLSQPLAGADAPVVVGYFSGTATHNRDFAQAAPALIQLLEQRPQVRLRLVGPLDPGDEFAPYRERIERRELVPLTELAAEIAAVDVALAPLELDNPYCQAKSEVKYMEAGLVGVPVVASPTEAFQVAIRHGVNGMLATTASEWLAALLALVDDPARRRAIGQAARDDVLDRYTPVARSRALLDVLDEQWAGASAARARSVGAPFFSAPTEPQAALLESIMTPSQKPHLRIGWLIYWPIPGSGGFSNIFRIINLLAGFGHENIIYMQPLGLPPEYIHRPEQYIRRHFGPVAATVQAWPDLIDEVDLALATDWGSFEVLERCTPHVRKAYFVQDFEPFFNEMGYRYLKAEATYRAGVPCITLGNWLATFLRETYDATTYPFDFAVEHERYHPRRSARPDQTRIFFYARPSTPRRCFELGAAALAIVHERHPEVEIVLFGDLGLTTLPVKFPFEDLGILDHEELAKLYASSTIGLVLSATNPSLMPPEMMASRCAVIDLDLPPNHYLIDHSRTGLLIEPQPAPLADAICRLLEDEPLRLRLVDNAEAAVKALSWEHSARQVEQAMLTIAPLTEARPTALRLDLNQSAGDGTTPPLSADFTIGQRFVLRHNGLCRIAVAGADGDGGDATPTLSLYESVEAEKPLLQIAAAERRDGWLIYSFNPLPAVRHRPLYIVMSGGHGSRFRFSYEPAGGGALAYHHVPQAGQLCCRTFYLSMAGDSAISDDRQQSEIEYLSARQRLSAEEHLLLSKYMIKLHEHIAAAPSGSGGVVRGWRRRATRITGLLRRGDMGTLAAEARSYLRWLVARGGAK